MLDARPESDSGAEADTARVQWDNERVALLRKLWTEEGLTGSQIADRIVGTTRNAVLAKLDRLGLLRRKARIETSTGVTQVAANFWRRNRAVPKARPMLPPTFEPEPQTGVEVLDVPPEQRVKLLDLAPHHCRWPLGDPGTPEFGFCGARKGPVGSYCTAHHKASIMPPLGRSPRAEVWHATRRRVVA